MLNLKYLNENTSYEVSFKSVKSNIVQITGRFPIKEKGFVLIRDGVEDDPWDYTKFTTVYREILGGAQFSSDGSVYVPPQELEPIPEPEPYIPTEEELAAFLEQNKKEKINLSKSLLGLFLENNPIVSMAHNNTAGVYSVTSEKQALMMSQYMTYQIAKTVNPNAKLTWNETGKSCEEWTEQEFMQLILEIKEYVYPLVSSQQTLEERINECVTQEELDAIVIDYAVIHNKIVGEV